MTTTTTAQLHPAITAAVPGLGDALDRWAAQTVLAREDERALAAAQATFDAEVTGSDYAARQSASLHLAAAKQLAESSRNPTPDGDGLRCLRLALDQALRYASDRTERRPVADRRDRPQPLRPDTPEQREAQARARRVLAELRSRCDAWHHDPAKLGYAEVVALLGDLSRGCETADQLRALVSPPAPPPVLMSARTRRQFPAVPDNRK
ncbi:MAG: hypothetical protein WAL35_03205 [Acidimicrobiales bacterium]